MDIRSPSELVSTKSGLEAVCVKAGLVIRSSTRLPFHWLV